MLCMHDTRWQQYNLFRIRILRISRTLSALQLIIPAHYTWMTSLAFNQWFSFSPFCFHNKIEMPVMRVLPRDILLPWKCQLYSTVLI